MKFMDWIERGPARIGFDHRGPGLPALDIQASSSTVSLIPGQELPLVTSTNAGIMDPADKVRLDALQNTLVTVEAVNFQTRSQITVSNITDPQMLFVRTAGYFTTGDGGHALYQRAASEPGHAFKVQSADGTWWEGIPENGQINICALGAVGDWDGSSGTDNTSVISDCMQAAASIEQATAVFVPGGTFRADGIFMQPGVTLRGDGVASRLAASNGSSNLLSMADDTIVEGLHFIGQNLADASGGGIGNGIRGPAVQNITIRNCRFHGFGSPILPGAGAIRFDGICGTLRVVDNYITGGLGGGVDADISFYNNQTSDVIVTGNYCLSSNRQGIAFQIGGPQVGRRIVTGNHCQNHTDHGIALGYIDNQSEFLDVICSNNVCYNNAAIGIYLASGVAGGGSVSITDNIITRCGGHALIGEPLQGGIITSGNLPVLIANNHISWTGYNDADVAGSTRAFGIHAAGKKQHVIDNIIYRGNSAGIRVENNSRDALIEGNKIYGTHIWITLGAGVGRIGINDNDIDNSEFDDDGIYIQHLGAHGANEVSINRNTIKGSKAGTGKIGFRSIFGFVGEFTGNKIYEFDTAHDLGGDTGTGYWDGTRIKWSDNVYENNTTAIQYQQTTDAFGPLLSLNNVFRDNTTDVFAVADLSLYQAIAVGGGNRVVWGDAVPTLGTWAVGDRVQNSAPAVGSPKGWVCTAAGSPGTWVAEGNL